MEESLLHERCWSAGLTERLKARGKCVKKHCSRESLIHLSSGFVAGGNIPNTEAGGNEVSIRFR